MTEEPVRERCVLPQSRWHPAAVWVPRNDRKAFPSQEPSEFTDPDRSRGRSLAETDGPAPPPATMPEPFLDDAPVAGDEADPGTPGTGEDICKGCGGTGSQKGRICPTCEGRGRVVKAIGGA